MGRTVEVMVTVFDKDGMAVRRVKKRAKMVTEKGRLQGWCFDTPVEIMAGESVKMDIPDKTGEIVQYIKKDVGASMSSN